MDLQMLLGEALYAQLVDKLGDRHQVAIVSNGKWLPKVKFDALNRKKQTLQAELKECEKQLAELQVMVEEQAELEKQLHKLQAKLEAVRAIHTAELRELKLDSAVKLAIATEVYDPDVVTMLLDKSKMEIDEEGRIISGLEDQLQALRASKAFLFVQEDSTIKFKGVTPYRGWPPTEKGGDKVVCANQ